jgi:hypothetical protein
VPPYLVIAISATTFLTIVSVQVALARRARQIGTVVSAAIALLVMTGVAYASIRMSARGPDGLPEFLTLYILRVSASLYAVVLLATTCAALWLARRTPMPRTPIHWAMTAAAGLCIYALTTQSGFFPLELVTATDDGMGTRGVTHPTPEERMARAQTLPACSITALTPPKNPAWRWQTVSPVGAELPMPAAMREEPNEVPDDPGIQQWTLERWGDLVLERDEEAQQSTGFMIGGGAGAVAEPSCALRVGSNVVPVARSASVVRRRGASGTDSMFTATTDVPVTLPDTQLGVGITAHTRAGRDTLLSILAAMRFVDRDSGRRVR